MALAHLHGTNNAWQKHIFMEQTIHGTSTFAWLKQSMAQAHLHGTNTFAWLKQCMALAHLLDIAQLKATI